MDSQLFGGGRGNTVALQQSRKLLGIVYLENNIGLALVVGKQGVHIGNPAYDGKSFPASAYHPFPLSDPVSYRQLL